MHVPHTPAPHPPATNGRFRRLAVITALATAVGLVTAPAVNAQTTIPPLQAISVTVNLNVATPSGVTGYRFDSMCRGVPGTPTGELNLSLAFGSSGGTGQVLVPLSSTVSCAFRLVVLGSGPRPLIGNAIFVGNVARPVGFPTTVDGVAVDPSTVIETAQIPITGATTVLVGPAVTPPTTTVAPTTTTAAPTTTRPPATTTPPTTAVVVVPASPTTKAVAVPTKKPVKKVLTKRVCTKIRHKKCVAYRRVRVR